MTDGEWVASGSFKIDRAAALEKLARYQSLDPTRFLLSWIRAAVAAGARSVTVERADRTLVFEAAGGRFSRDEFAEVYDPLLAPVEGPARAKRFHLALGFLALERMEPEEVEIEPANGRGAVGGARIVVRARPSSRGGRLFRALEWPETECAGCPIPITLPGMEVPRLAASRGDWLEYRHRSVRAWVRPALTRLQGHRAAFSCLGVRGATLELESDLAGVDGLIEHPELALDLSQTGVVRDEAYGAAVEALRQAAGRLIESVAAQVASDLPRLLSTWVDGKDGYPVWRNALSNVAPREVYGTPPWIEGSRLGWAATAAQLLVPLSSSLDAGLREPEYALARKVAWLRSACLRLLDPRADRGRPGAEALWGCPCYATSGRSAVALRRIERRRAKSGTVFLAPRLWTSGLLNLFGARARECASVPELTKLLATEAGDNLSDEVYG
ncbi:MAG: hypothetical protein HY553_21695 [Elusimicrobia bacterium]|nr:hypothetical protein [Elusimicrobiota bacterium]